MCSQYTIKEHVFYTFINLQINPRKLFLALFGMIFVFYGLRQRKYVLSQDKSQLNT